MKANQNDIIKINVALEQVIKVRIALGITQDTMDANKLAGGEPIIWFKTF